MSRMRIRELMSSRARRGICGTASILPVRGVEGEKLDVLRVEVQQRRARRAEHPAAGLAGIHDERLVLRLHALFVREAMHDDAVRLDGAFLHVADVVDEQDLVSGDFETVRRLEDLQTETGTRAR